ncbi:hypothetical protein D1007_05389 [Hordeum vulgare]|nr:hypothetical protein D1007_05389 [Hordeum vulgare]
MIAATSDDHARSKRTGEVLNVRFHFGGEFIRIGPSLDYVGGDTAMSLVERDKLSLPELKGFLADHLTVKESMKLYFLMPGRDLVNGLLFLYTDEGCMKMSDYITDAGVDDIYVEYSGEQDDADEEDSTSDFEKDELHDLVNNGSEGEPDAVITAEEEDVMQSNVQQVGSVQKSGILEHILVPNEGGVVTQVIKSPVKHNFRSGDLSQCSQVVNPSQPVVASQVIPPIPEVVGNGEDSEDSDDPDYVAHTDDSGEESEVAELRKHARKFKKKMKASEIWFAKESSGPVPIELVANVEEVVQHMEFQSFDEDYSYDEDEDGQMVRRNNKYIRFNPDS